jgi:hypothetical protein
VNELAYKPKRYRKFVAAATSATLIAAAITEKMYTVVAFKSKNTLEGETRYLPDGLEQANWENDYGDVDNLDEALLLTRVDSTQVTEEDVKVFVDFMEKLNTFESGYLPKNYEHVYVEVTETQLKANYERNSF